MSRQELEQTLQRVPLLATLGVRVEDAKPGKVVLRLPAAAPTKSFEGALYSAAVFALAELTAAVALGTHPLLVDLEPLQKRSTITYLATSRKDVTAHADITQEMIDAIRAAVDSGGRAQIEVPVKVMDGHGADVARLQGVFGFRSRL